MGAQKGIVRNDYKRVDGMTHPKGVVLCEYQNGKKCSTEGQDFERTKAEAKKWDKLTDELKEMLPYRNIQFMPITLCKKHAKNRNPLIKVK